MFPRGGYPLSPSSDLASRSSMCLHLENIRLCPHLAFFLSAALDPDKAVVIPASSVRNAPVLQRTGRANGQNTKSQFTAFLVSPQRRKGGREGIKKICLLSLLIPSSSPLMAFPRNLCNSFISLREHVSCYFPQCFAPGCLL